MPDWSNKPQHYRRSIARGRYSLDLDTRFLRQRAKQSESQTFHRGAGLKPQTVILDFDFRVIATHPHPYRQSTLRGLWPCVLHRIQDNLIAQQGKSHGAIDLYRQRSVEFAYHRSTIINFCQRLGDVGQGNAEIDAIKRSRLVDARLDRTEACRRPVISLKCSRVVSST